MPNTQTYPNGAKVTIVGAGLAGLTCAYELESLGFKVNVLESDKTHIGGRVRTIRFGENAYAEAGAMRIPAHHNLTREYASKFELTLRPFIQYNDDSYSRIRNHIRRSGDDVEYPIIFDLESSELGQSPSEIWEATVGHLVKSLTDIEKKDLFAVNIETRKIRQLDQYSLMHWLKSRGVSNEAIQMLASAWSMESSLHSALTAHLRTHINGTWLNDFSEIVGGTDRLPAAMANSLKTPVMQGCKVTKILHRGQKAVVYFQEGKARKSLESDYVICTAPLGPTRRINFDPAMSDKKREAMRRVNYDSSTKVIAHTKNRFWETHDGIYGGGSSDDDILGSIWYPNDNSERNQKISQMPSAFVASYNWGQQSRRVSNDKTAVRQALSQFHTHLNQQPSDLIKLIPWSWDKFVHSEGAYAHFLPGEHSSLHAELIESEGRIHFAGEHTSLDHAWMQGAIESALRVVDEISSS